MRYKALLVATAALAAIAAQSACSDDGPDPIVPGPSPSSTLSAPTVPVTPTPSLTPEERKVRSAEHVVVEFWTVVDALAADPKLNLNKLNQVAADQTVLSWQDMLTGQRVRGERQVGSTIVVSVSGQYAGSSRYAVTACIDVSQVDVVDKHGKSVVAPNRPARVQYRHTVVEGPDGQFYISNDKATQTC